MIRKLQLSAFLFFFGFFGIVAQEKPSAEKSENINFNTAGFDAYVQNAVKDWNVPGLAVVVVKGDSVVFQKAYGLLELGKKEPVDPETIFAAASTTKAFTAAAIGMLVDEGKLNWDDPVVKHLPEFKIRDPYLTGKITVRDLLTHRAGLPNTDYLWINPETSTEEMVQRLKHVETTYSFRSGFIYQNVMYTVAGEVVEAVSGMTWNKFIETRFLQPLKMNRTFSSLAASRKAGNIAAPHDYSGEELVPIDNSFADAIGPAGSMWTSVADMSKWLKFLLKGCETATGEKLLKESTCEELFKPQTVMAEPAYPTAVLTNPNWNSYGLGWFQHDYEGRKVDFHTGSLAGMVAIAGLIRDEGIGVYVLANRDHAEVRHALMYRVFDLFDGKPPRDWSSELKALYDKLEEKQKLNRQKQNSANTKERIKNTKPSLPLQSYAGTYSDPLFGTVEVKKAADQLLLEFGGITGTLEHWHFNSFRFITDEGLNESSLLVDFDLNSAGKPEKVKVMAWEFTKE